MLLSDDYIGVAMQWRGQVSGTFIASLDGGRRVLELYYFCTEIQQRGFGSVLCELLSGVAAELEVDTIKCHALDRSIKFWRRMRFSPTVGGGDSHYKDTQLLERGVPRPAVCASNLGSVLRGLDDRLFAWRIETHGQMKETAAKEEYPALNLELQRTALVSEGIPERQLTPVGIRVANATRGSLVIRPQ